MFLNMVRQQIPQQVPLAKSHNIGYRQAGPDDLIQQLTADLGHHGSLVAAEGGGQIGLHHLLEGRRIRRAAELLRDRELDVDLYLLGSTREEVSGAGATVGTWAVQPDFCVAVDVTHGKTPDGPADKAFAIGGGPAIGVGPNMTRWMTDRMLAKAKERQIPYQLEVMSGHTGTNGWEMQISREGVATSVLSLPLKYMHSPIEVLSLADMEQVAALLVAFTEGLGKEAARR